MGRMVLGMALLVNLTLPRVWRNLRDEFPHPYTAADADRWIRQATESSPQTHFAIAIEDEADGWIGLDLKTQCTRRYSSGIRPRSGCSRRPATPSKDDKTIDSMMYAIVRA